MATTVHGVYSESHPWITFRADLSRAGAEFWMLLGETRSKVEHLTGSLLKPEVAETLNSLYLAKGVHATTAIEGNTLSEEQALGIVEGKLELPPAQQYLAQEIGNIIDACNAIKDRLVAGESPALTLEAIKDFNRRVLAGLELGADVSPGAIRTRGVTVGRYRGVPAADCEPMLERLCSWLNGPDFEPANSEWEFPFALIKAVLAHLYVAWIHPFGDGNGRTARLIELQILLGAGFPMPAAHLLSNHYNATRSEYYRQLDLASSSRGEILSFLQYAVAGFVDGIRAQLGQVRWQQYDDRWEQYVYESFGAVSSRARERQRKLVLELSNQIEPVPRSRLPSMDIDLALAYRGTERMLSRDLNALVKMGLIERVPEGWRPRRERILAFLPVRRPEGT